MTMKNLKKISTIAAALMLFASTAFAYVGNISSRKFHYEACRAAKKIKAGNRTTFESRNEAVSAGYKPCGICRP